MKGIGEGAGSSGAVGVVFSEYNRNEVVEVVACVE